MSEQGEEISLKELILKIQEWYRFLLSKWKTILIAGIIGGCLGLGYSFIKKPVYTANLTFALEEKTVNAGGLGAIASQFGFNIGGSEGGAFSGDNIIELIKSRYIIEKTLLTEVEINGKKDLLVNRYIRFNKLDNEWAEDPDLNQIKFTKGIREEFSIKQDSILGDIYKVISDKMLAVDKVDKKLSIVKVNINSKDELFAKYFAENIVKNVTDFYIETKTSKSRANISLLEFRVDSVRRELDAAMYGRAQFSDQNMGLVRQSAAVPKVRQEMKVQMLSAMYGELIKNLEFSKLALMREEPLIQIIDYPILPLENDKIGKFKGLVFGSALFCFLTICMIIARKILKIFLQENEG